MPFLQVVWRILWPVKCSCGRRFQWIHILLQHLCPGQIIIQVVIFQPFFNHFLSHLFFIYLLVSFLFIYPFIYQCLDLITGTLGWATAEVTDKVKCCRQYTDTQEFCPSTVQVHRVHLYNYSTQKNRSSVLVQFRYIKYIYTIIETQEFCSSTVQEH